MIISLPDLLAIDEVPGSGVVGVLPRFTVFKTKIANTTHRKRSMNEDSATTAMIPAFIFRVVSEGKSALKGYCWLPNSSLGPDAEEPPEGGEEGSPVMMFAILHTIRYSIDGLNKTKVYYNTWVVNVYHFVIMK